MQQLMNIYHKRQGDPKMGKITIKRFIDEPQRLQVQHKFVIDSQKLIRYRQNELCPLTVRVLHSLPYTRNRKIVIRINLKIQQRTYWQYLLYTFSCCLLGNSFGCVSSPYSSEQTHSSVTVMTLKNLWGTQQLLILLP